MPAEFRWDEVAALITGAGAAHVAQVFAAVKRHVRESGIAPFDLSHFYGSVNSPGWGVVSVAPVRAVAMMQTSEGLVRRAWHA